MNYQNEQKNWSNIVCKYVGDDAELLNVSVFSSDCRIYSDGNTIFKIRHLTPASCRGRLSALEDEFLILNRLNGIAGIPRPLNYLREEGWEILSMSKMPPLVTYDPTLPQQRENLKSFLKVAFSALEINRRGCSHGDYHQQNIGLNTEGTLSIFDFDQSCIANPIQCWLRDFLGKGIYARPKDVSLFTRAGNVNFIWPIFKALSAAKKLLLLPIRWYQAKQGIPIADEIPLQQRVAMLNDNDLTKLSDAWNIAAHADASSPGKLIAYYSLDISGVNFPGERPWLFRWDMLNKSVDFKGKKLLELGSNLGLLSIHASLGGALSARGVDVDAQVVRASNLAASAFGAKEVSFTQLNLDDPNPWEEALDGYDIVSALSVMYWVKDQDRLWSFLGKHAELIYEGHDSVEDAQLKFRNLGFTIVNIIGFSERGRAIFHARKNLY